MSAEYELDRVNSIEKNFADTGREMIPIEEKPKAQVSQKSFLGIYCCLFLIFAGLCVNLYFITSLNQNGSKPRGAADHGCTGVSSQALSANARLSSTIAPQTHTAEHEVLMMASNKIDELTILIKSLNVTLSDVTTEFTKNSVQFGVSGNQQSQQTLDRIIETMDAASKSLADLADKLDTIQPSVLSYEDRSKNQTETFKRMLHEVTDVSIDLTGKMLDGISQKMDQLSMSVGLIMNKIDRVDEDAVSRKNDMNITLQKMMTDSLNLTMSNRIQNEALIQTNTEALTSLKTVLQDNLGDLLGRLDVFQDTTYDKLNGIDRMLNETHMVLDAKFRLQAVMENEKSQIWQNLTTYLNDIQASSAKQEDLLSSLYDSLGTQSSNISHQILENCRGNVVVSMLKNITAVTTVGHQTLKDEMIHVFSENQQQVRDSQERLHVQVTDLAQEVIRQNYGDVCSAITDKLENIENSTFTLFSNVSNALNSFVGGRPTDQPDVHSALVSAKEIIENLTQYISSSLAVSSDKLQSKTLSSAIVALLDDTKVIYEAIVNSSSSPVCRSDGCYIKTIPVGLTPSSTVVQIDSVRLANAQISSSNIQGRLEVYRSGSWGTVCDDSFSNTDARVVCRMFGYSSGTQKQSAYFGAGTGNIHMDDVGCSGRETSIFSCSYTSNHNCGHSEDVGIICT